MSYRDVRRVPLLHREGLKTLLEGGVVGWFADLHTQYLAYQHMFAFGDGKTKPRPLDEFSPLHAALRYKPDLRAVDMDEVPATSGMDAMRAIARRESGSIEQ